MLQIRETFPKKMEKKAVGESTNIINATKMIRAILLQS